MKATGKEINDFYNEGWPEGGEHVEYEPSVLRLINDNFDDAKGLLKLPESQKFDLGEFGYIDLGDTCLKFATHFRRWKKAQTVDYVTIEVKKESKKLVIARLNDMGLKVI